MNKASKRIVFMHKVSLFLLFLLISSCTSTNEIQKSQTSEKRQKEKIVKMFLEKDYEYQNATAQLKEIKSAIVRTRISLFGRGLTGASNTISKRSNFMNEYNMGVEQDVLSLLKADKANLENWIKFREMKTREYVDSHWNEIAPLLNEK